MSTITIKAFAQQIGIEPERVVKQLNDAGVTGKSVDDSLSDSEKRALLDFLRGGSAAKAGAEKAPASGRGKITLKTKTTSEIQQTTKTGIARTVQVQTKKRRTFVKREVLEQQEAERQEAEHQRQQQEALRLEEERRLQAIEDARIAAEQAEQQAAQAAAEKAAAEQAALEAEQASQETEQDQGNAAEESTDEAAEAAPTEAPAEPEVTTPETTKTEEVTAPAEPAKKLQCHRLFEKRLIENVSRQLFVKQSHCQKQQQHQALMQIKKVKVNASHLRVVKNYT